MGGVYAIIKTLAFELDGEPLQGFEQHYNINSFDVLKFIC